MHAFLAENDVVNSLFLNVQKTISRIICDLLSPTWRRPQWHWNKVVSRTRHCRSNVFLVLDPHLSAVDDAGYDPACVCVVCVKKNRIMCNSSMFFFWMHPRANKFSQSSFPKKTKKHDAQGKVPSHFFTTLVLPWCDPSSARHDCETRCSSGNSHSGWALDNPSAARSQTRPLKG